MNDKFPEIHDTTIEDQYKINTNVDGVECNVEILDTAGQEDYQAMLDAWISFADGYILVYSIDDSDSFEVIKKRAEKIINMKSKSGVPPPLIIVGNKIDLEYNRQVKYDDVYDYCKNKGIEFLECSALTKNNIKETFLKLFQKMIEKKNNNNSKTTKNNDKEVKKCFCF